MKKLLLLSFSALLLGCAPRATFDPAVQPKADDFGPHGDPIEWWYLSGYLPEQKLAFHWAQFQVYPPELPLGIPAYFSHIAVTDLNTGQMRFWEQSPALGNGQASFPPLKLSNRDWTFNQLPDNVFQLDAGPLKLSAKALKPPVIHPPGYSGVPEVTGAMYYQSITQLALSGSIGGQAVKGMAWLDHQWGGMNIGRKGVWDWMSIHLQSGDDLMLYRVRTLDGQAIQTFGTVVDKSGAIRALQNLKMQPGRTWKSESGREYTLTWKLEADGLALDVAAVRDQQEMLGGSTRIVYWEGPIEVSGTWQGAATQGNGMMELVSGLTAEGRP